MLRAWDLHDDLDSQRRDPVPPLREPRAGRGAGGRHARASSRTQFDANDPVHTPNGLNIANPAVEQSFADAVSDLRNAGIPLDAPLRDWQYERRGSERIPIHGGPGSVGVFNAINVGWVGSGANAGYPNVPHGSSFVMAAQFTGRPGLPGRHAHDPHLLAVDEPELAVLRRPDAHVLEQGVGRRGLLRGRDRGRPEPRGDGRSPRRTGYPRPEGRDAAARVARARVRAVHGAEPHPRRRRSRSRRARRRRRRRQPDGRDARRERRPAKSVGFVRLGVQRRRPGAARRLRRGDHGRPSPTCAAARCRRRTVHGARTRPAGRDYTGELEATADLRVTDRFNGVDAGGGDGRGNGGRLPVPGHDSVLRHAG